MPSAARKQKAVVESLLRAPASSFPSFIFSLSPSPHLRALHSFPTRRSSDLLKPTAPVPLTLEAALRSCVPPPNSSVPWTLNAPLLLPPPVRVSVPLLTSRSEEHTSELQSPYDLVCRLLLENKKLLLNPCCAPLPHRSLLSFFLFRPPPTSAPSTLSLHDALPIC